MSTEGARNAVAAPRSIYAPREDTFLLLAFARGGTGLWLLEIGCGAGWAALEAARSGWRVVGTDLNPDALTLLQTRAWNEGLAVAVVRSDLGGGLRRFDRILANPPYLPTRPSERDPDRWVNLALDGGPDGTRATRRLITKLPGLLTEDGVAYVIVSSLQPAERLDKLARDWTRRSGSVRTVAERRLEGETLSVWEFRRRSVGSRDPNPRARRGATPRRGSGARRLDRPLPRSGSSREPAHGGRRVPDAA